MLLTIAKRSISVTERRASCLYLLRSFRGLSTESATSEEGIQTSNEHEFGAHNDDLESQALRDASRLPPRIYQKYHGQAPDVPYKDLQHIRERYARFGVASGEDARILWPSRREILSLEQDEMEEGTPLMERLADLRSQQQAEQEAIMERRKMIEKNMEQMPKWISEYRNKQKVLEEEARKRAEKKESLLEEARDHFGYRIKANDPKFQQMVEEKEERERKETKKRKREEKMRKQADRLAAEISKVSEITKSKTQT